MIINIIKTIQDSYYLKKNGKIITECKNANEISSITILDLFTENFQYCNGFSINNIPNEISFEILKENSEKFIVKFNDNILKENNNKIKVFNKFSSIGEIIIFINHQ